MAAAPPLHSRLDQLEAKMAELDELVTELSVAAVGKVGGTREGATLTPIPIPPPILGMLPALADAHALADDVFCPAPWPKRVQSYLAALAAAPVSERLREMLVAHAQPMIALADKVHARHEEGKARIAGARVEVLAKVIAALHVANDTDAADVCAAIGGRVDRAWTGRGRGTLPDAGLFRTAVNQRLACALEEHVTGRAPACSWLLARLRASGATPTAEPNVFFAFDWRGADGEIVPEAVVLSKLVGTGGRAALGAAIRGLAVNPEVADRVMSSLSSKVPAGPGLSASL